MFIKRSALALHLGSHWRLMRGWPLRRLADRYTSKGQSSQVIDLLKDLAIVKPQASDTHVKLYIQAHGAAGRFYVRSENKLKIFGATDLAKKIHAVIQALNVSEPLTLSLIICEAAKKGKGSDQQLPFAAHLAAALLSQHGHKNILIKARTGGIYSLLGMKLSLGKKYHFYMHNGGVVSVLAQHDLRYLIKKTLMKCIKKTPSHQKKVTLNEILQNLIMPMQHDQRASIQASIQTALSNPVVQKTAGWTHFFGSESASCRRLKALSEQLERDQGSLLTQTNFYSLSQP